MLTQEGLHPAGNVKNLHDALNFRFDEFDELQQDQVQYEKCEKGYNLESEGQCHVTAFLGDVGVREGALWSELP